MGIIARVIAVVADVTVLGFTLQRTIYIFKVDEEIRANNQITTILAYNGNMIYSQYLNPNIANGNIYRFCSIWVGLICVLQLKILLNYCSALLILNILLTVLDILSVGSNGVRNKIVIYIS